MCLVCVLHRCFLASVSLHLRLFVLIAPTLMTEYCGVRYTNILIYPFAMASMHCMSDLLLCRCAVDASQILSVSCAAIIFRDAEGYRNREALIWINL